MRNAVNSRVNIFLRASVLMFTSLCSLAYKLTIGKIGIHSFIYSMQDANNELENRNGSPIDKQLGNWIILKH